MAHKKRLEFYLGTQTGTPALIAYNSGYQTRPEIVLSGSDWETPLNRTNINADNPASVGGSFADPFPTWPGKILTLELTVLSPSAYRRHQLSQQIKALTQQTAFVNIKRIQEFTTSGIQTVEWLNDCYFTDVSGVEIPAWNQMKFGIVLTSKNADSTAPVESAL